MMNVFSSKGVFKNVVILAPSPIGLRRKMEYLKAYAFKNCAEYKTEKEVKEQLKKTEGRQEIC